MLYECQHAGFRIDLHAFRVFATWNKLVRFLFSVRWLPCPIAALIDVERTKIATRKRGKLRWRNRFTPIPPQDLHYKPLRARPRRTGLLEKVFVRSTFSAPPARRRARPALLGRLLAQAQQCALLKVRNHSLVHSARYASSFGVRCVRIQEGTTLEESFENVQRSPAIMYVVSLQMPSRNKCPAPRTILK